MNLLNKILETINNLLAGDKLTQEEKTALQIVSEASKKQLIKIDIVIDDTKDMYEQERCGLCNEAMSREVVNKSYESESFDFCANCGQAANR